ncbi:MAG: hypothetical protein HY922_05805 [Elusimicrobia bacterium]|nr:hypothetical protein [Elusimicrobiota bacterium]
MRNERVVIKILGRELEVEIDGLTPLEVPLISKYIDDKARELSREHKIVDTMRLQIYLIAELATEIHLLNAKFENLDRAEEKRLEGMITSLQSALRQAAT